MPVGHVQIGEDVGHVVPSRLRGSDESLADRVVVQPGSDSSRTWLSRSVSSGNSSPVRAWWLPEEVEHAVGNGRTEDSLAAGGNSIVLNVTTTPSATIEGEVRE